MGLDMYWFASKTAEEKAEALLLGEDPEKGEEIGYFRKFYRLNEFLGDFYQNVDDFNCEDLEMDAEIVADMKVFAETFTDPSEWEKEDLATLCSQVIPAIEKALNEGRRVVYVP